MTKGMEVDHEFNTHGELILMTRINGNLIKRRYLYYSFNDAKKHFKTYIKQIT